MIETIISFVGGKMPLADGIIFISITLLLAISSFVYFFSYTYLRKLKRYYFFYYFGIVVAVVAVLVLYLGDFITPLKTYYVHRYIAGIYGLSFLYSTITPLLMHRSGLKIFMPRFLRVPHGGTDFEVEVRNLTNISDEIEIFFNPPNNVSLIKTDDSEFVKKVKIGGKARVFVKIKIEPKLNNDKKLASVNIKSHLIGDTSKEIEIIT